MRTFQYVQIDVQVELKDMHQALDHREDNHDMQILFVVLFKHFLLVDHLWIVDGLID